MPKAAPVPADDAAATPAPQADTAAYRRAAMWSLIALAAIAVVGSVVGYLIDGTTGLWSALAASGIAAIFSLTTSVAAWFGSTRGPMVFVGVVAVTWLFKMIVVIVAMVVAQNNESVNRPLFGAVVLTGALTALAIEITTVLKARIPYVTPAP